MAKKRTHEEFIQLMAELHPNLVVVGKYVDALTPVQVHCNRCGNESHPQPNNLLGSKNRKPTGCKFCAGNVAKTDEQFYIELFESNPTIEPLDRYPGNNKTKMRFRCKVCGYRWSAPAQDVLQGHGCNECASKSRRELQLMSQTEFERRVAESSPGIRVVGEYGGSHALVEVECERCHHAWSTIAWNLVCGSGCPKCDITAGSSFTERFILAALRDCLGEGEVLSRDRSTLGMELDIFIPCLSVAIEPGCWYWHSSQVDRDIEKRRLSEERDIRLIVIYDGFDYGEVPFDTDCYVFECNLGEPKNRHILRNLVESLLVDLGIERNFSELQWRRFAREANARDSLTQEAFVAELAVANPKIALVGHYSGFREPVAVKCSCGNVFTTLPSVLLEGRGCRSCSSKKANRARMMTQEEFERRVKEKSPNIKVLGEYEGSGKKVEVTCLVCHKTWSPWAGDLLEGHGCGKGHTPKEIEAVLGA